MRILEGQGVTKFFGGLAAVSHVDFHVDRGEILGLAGLVGAGRTELARLIYGADQADGGEVFVRGRKARIRLPASEPTDTRHGAERS